MICGTTYATPGGNYNKEVVKMRDLGLLIIRLVMGSLLAGHGAQKLFGSFEGPGPQGTARWLESMKLRPGTRCGQGKSPSYAPMRAGWSSSTVPSSLPPADWPTGARSTCNLIFPGRFPGIRMRALARLISAAAASA